MDSCSLLFVGGGVVVVVDGGGVSISINSTLTSKCKDINYKLLRKVSELPSVHIVRPQTCWRNV